MLKHSSPNEVDLSPSLNNDSGVFWRFMYQIVAVLGSVLLVSSGSGWISLSMLKWKCKCSNKALDVFFYVFHGGFECSEFNGSDVW